MAALGLEIRIYFFADDSLHFMETTEVAARKIREVLENYEVASGQQINLKNSSVLFEKGGEYAGNSGNGEM